MQVFNLTALQMKKVIELLLTSSKTLRKNCVVDMQNTGQHYVDMINNINI